MSGSKSRSILGNVYVLAVLAMLVAMEVVLNRFLSINTAGLKIGFAFIPPVLAAILFGPVESAIVYALSDFIGAMLFPIGTYHPGFTVCAALMGIVAGLFLNKRPLAIFKCNREWKKIRFFPNIVVPVVFNCIVLGLLVNTLWVSQLYGSKTYGGWFMYRLSEYAIMVPVQLLIIPLLLQFAELLKKSGVFNFRKAGRSEEKLKQISRSVSIPGLSRVTELLNKLGDPQDKLRVIHVAGTNGKGSFVAMLASVLCSEGYSVGSFSSPALTGVTESFRINGEEISNAELEKLLAEIEPLSAGMQDKPTEFEVLTAAAYLLFKKRGCDIAVVECGMGGLLDATNVLKAPLLSVITNVQKDHCSYLGNTISEIAAHKAGIIKPGCPVLFGGEDDEALEVVKIEAERLGAPLYVTDHSKTRVREANLNGTVMDHGVLKGLRLSLLGAYQPVNAANVIEAVEILNGLGVEVSEHSLREGLASAKWPGRFELLAKNVIYDGSHNPDGIEYVAKSLKKYYPDKKAVLLIGVMADKDYELYPQLLAGCAERVFAVHPENTRALPADKLAECFTRAGIPALAFDDLQTGVAEAFDYATAKELPLAALGTLYMYSDFKNALSNLL